MKLSSLAWQFPNRVIRFSKRRLNYLRYWFYRMARKPNQPKEKTAGTTIASLKTGDLVKVKAREEIRATLDEWNSLKGCIFLEEMWCFCGTNQRVMKRLERFLDERDYRVKTSKNIVLLEGVICQGTMDFGRCDRSCFFFWQEDWLEKIS